ncbi:MAG: hypothetical protein Q8O52_15280 [Sulfuritalea sp.]|nr:hypothetical protein [Sulfuritalea sp.]
MRYENIITGSSVITYSLSVSRNTITRRSTTCAKSGPTATDYFYLDFVCELNDGRVPVVEYKGAHLLNDETREKAQVGHQWETSSGGRCLFLLVVMQDDRGRDVAGQIVEKIGST